MNLSYVLPEDSPHVHVLSHEKARLLTQKKDHRVVVLISSSIQLRQFSFSPVNKRVKRVSTARIIEIHPLSSMKGYVTVEYDGHYWLCCVTKVEAHLAEVNFLHSQLHVAAKSYVYPRH